jgi:hypothetical protein
MKKWAVAGACAVVAAIVVYFTIFRASDEDRIRQTLTRLAKAASVKEDDNPLSRTGRIKSEFKEIVTDVVSVDIAEVNIRVTGRPELVEKAVMLGGVYSPATIDFSSMTIKIDEASSSAKVDAVAVLTGTRGGEKHVDKRDVHFLLHKDGSWKITTIDVLPPRSD